MSSAASLLFAAPEMFVADVFALLGRRQTPPFRHTSAAPKQSLPAVVAVVFVVTATVAFVPVVVAAMPVLVEIVAVFVVLDILVVV